MRRMAYGRRHPFLVELELRDHAARPADVPVVEREDGDDFEELCADRAREDEEDLLTLLTLLTYLLYLLTYFTYFTYL